MWYQKRQNKFNAKSSYYNNVKYDSLKEAGKAQELDLLKKGKAIKDWETHKKIELFGENGTRVANYYIDFVVYHNDDTIEYIEIKSSITATYAWKLKWNLFEDKMKYKISRGEVKLTVEY